MNKHASKYTAKRGSSTGKGIMKTLSPAEDPMWFLFERHRYNPFVRFLREAFFYDDEDPRRLAHDRVPTQRAFGNGQFHGGTLRF
jgi:hypothetical protein